MASDTIRALTVTYRAGERIVAAGEPGACLFVVQSGSVRLSRPGTSDGGPVEIARLEKGDIFGEGSLLEGRPYAADADAIDDCEVLEFGPSTFDRMVKSHPEVALRLLRQLAARIERVEGRLARAATGPATGTAEPVAPEAPAPSAAARPSRLVQEDGSAVFALQGAEMLIGRYDPVTEIQPEIDLGPLDTKRSVSRRHARLNQKDGLWYLAEESGALNGTFVNGIRLLQGRGAPLCDGDVVSLGMVRLVFRDGREG